MTAKKHVPYRPGELEIILSLIPTEKNIQYLSKLLDRSEASIKIIYQVAYNFGTLGGNPDIEERKIVQAKKRVGIIIGRQKRLKKSPSGKPLKYITKKDLEELDKKERDNYKMLYDNLYYQFDDDGSLAPEK